MGVGDRRRVSSGFGGLLTGISPAFASEPLPVLNQSPLPHQRARLLSEVQRLRPGSAGVLRAAYPTHHRRVDSESLFLDGQSDALSVAVATDFRGLDVEVTVSATSLRGFHGQAHRRLAQASLPNADRDRYLVDDLQYRLTQPVSLIPDEPASGIGDVHISIVRRLLVIDGGQYRRSGATCPPVKSADWLGSKCH